MSAVDEEARPLGSSGPGARNEASALILPEHFARALFPGATRLDVLRRLCISRLGFALDRGEAAVQYMRFASDTCPDDLSAMLRFFPYSTLADLQAAERASFLSARYTSGAKEALRLAIEETPLKGWRALEERFR